MRALWPAVRRQRKRQIAMLFRGMHESEERQEQQEEGEREAKRIESEGLI